MVSLRDQLVGDLKSTLWAVTAGVGCVLLIACANLAGLLLTRGVGRERDFAVRAALGAGRARLIRQTLIESLLLAGAGGGAGILIAQLTMPFLRYLVPVTLTAWSELQIDLRLAGFLLLVSMLAAVLSGTLPALLFSRTGLSDSLQLGGRVAASGSTRIRKKLIVSEVALAVVLLVGAGLLSRTLWALAHVPLGFQPAGVMTLRTSLPISAIHRTVPFRPARNSTAACWIRWAPFPGLFRLDTRRSCRSPMPEARVPSSWKERRDPIQGSPTMPIIG